MDSTSDPMAGPMADLFFGKIGLILFDADGTLRACTVPGQPCPNAPDQWARIPGVAAQIQDLVKHHSTMRFGIVSNQGGIELGYVEHEVAADMLIELRRQIFAPIYGNHEPALKQIIPIAMCPHAPSAGCSCRKPEPGGMWRILGFHNGAGWTGGMEHVLFVGDRLEDAAAARRVGCGFVWAWEFFGWEGYIKNYCSHCGAQLGWIHGGREIMRWPGPCAECCGRI